ncbi:murein L,D-transpeptidase catalytic domain family protein [Salinicola halimionae]|uniref:murein L,D-transpeptidase catalytic domain family protein n=1 Tax=Salinicola halimionae TaxID=1949081 RepID=UPI000DA19250|nr:murein L,D-transpeptidase catalytic domain family protein [Salinicola halimionae]
MTRILLPVILLISSCFKVVIAAPADAATLPAPSNLLAHADVEYRLSAESLDRLAPDADPDVIALGLATMQCAQLHGVGEDAQRLAIIDYSRSSLTPRLWVFDLTRNELLYREVVAHGQGSGGDVPDRFSNQEGSHASSLGLFVTRQTYEGKNGYSLRMDGLEPGFNDAAMSRAIVMHGADYVDPAIGERQGRLGRSWGCPALRPEIAGDVIDVLKDGQFVFSYYPERDWLMHSALAQCGLATVERENADARFLSSR